MHLAGRRQNGWGDSQRQTCKACGLPDKFDFHVSNEIWAAVVPVHLLNRVVCLGCFDDFAYRKGVDYATSLRTVYFAGDKGVFRLGVVDATAT
jgi:hypothetical protein